MKMRGPWLLVLLLTTWSAAQTRTASFDAVDSLHVTADQSPDAQSMLEDLGWAPGPFRVFCTAEGGEVRVYFPSPRPRRGPADPGDIVTLEWHVARDDAREPIEAPAVVVIHTIHPDMPIGRAVARGLAQRGFHAFMLQMPGFGERWQAEDDRPEHFMPRLHQAIADARRARDAVAVLPHVKSGPIAIQGTSLGGVVAANAAALDNAFDPVLLVITGGDLRTIVETGHGDAAFLRWRLERGGITGDRLADMCRRLEPNRIAHRLDPKRTWLFTAENDIVIPPACSDALAAAIHLPDDHRITVPGNHYTVLTRMPAIVEAMVRRLRGEEDAASRGAP